MFVPRRCTVVITWALAVSLNCLCSASVISWPLAFGLGQIAAPPTSSRALVDLLLRGGSSTSTSSAAATAAPDKILEAEERLLRVLYESNGGGKFHVHGWRWHTMSVMREAERLQTLALKMDSCREQLDLAQLRKAADYVVDFNLKALHRVENMFFPWMRQRMIESKLARPETKEAFDAIVENLEGDQKRLAELGRSITRSMASSKASTASTVAAQSGELVALSKSMLEREMTYVIPTVGLFVPEKEQKKFNNQVITFLGVLEARCHLVHMHEVVTEANSALEEELWKESIPSLPRSMIPRWKRTLYEPRASMLNVQ